MDRRTNGLVIHRKGWGAVPGQPEAAPRVPVRQGAGDLAVRRAHRDRRARAGVRGEPLRTGGVDAAVPVEPAVQRLEVTPEVDAHLDLPVTEEHGSRAGPPLLAHRSTSKGAVG